jgi:hypothetical protein
MMPASGGRGNRPESDGRGQARTNCDVVVDRHGIPLAVTLWAAKVHDVNRLEATLDAIEAIKPPVGRPRVSAWPNCMPIGPMIRPQSDRNCGAGASRRRLLDGASSRRRNWGVTGGWWREATYNTPIQTTAIYPMIGLTGLLNLVTVVDKFRPQAAEEKGRVCQPPSSPPAPRSRRAPSGVDATARRESPTPPVAAQPAAGAPAARRGRAGGGRR